MTPSHHEFPNSMDQLGMVLTQHHKAEVFLEKSTARRKNSLSEWSSVYDKGEPYCYH